MKKVLVGVFLAVLVALSGSTADAQVRSWDNLDWWAQNDAFPAPVRDAHGPGYWWWPDEPASNTDDQELWGNRGIVYAIFTPAPPPLPDEFDVGTREGTATAEPTPELSEQTPAPEPEPAPEIAAEPAPEPEPEPEPKPEPTAEPEPEPGPAPPEPNEPEPVPEPERSVPVFNHVLFDFDKSELSESGLAEVAGAVAILNENPGDTVTIEGHTCDLNRSSELDYNVKLGQRRANAVRAALVDAGIDADRVATASHGDTQPAVPNTTEENRAMNRRVVFVYAISD